jgi:hypothetical protein
MKLSSMLALAATVIVAATPGAEARPNDGSMWAHTYEGSVTSARPRAKARSARASRATYRAERNDRSYGQRYSGVGPRPGKWCGWWMRTQKGGGPQYNLAWNWRNYGSAGSPQVGAVVVWRHHVGMITGRAANGQWIVTSGNDGGRVRSRPRSIAGAVIRV